MIGGLVIIILFFFVKDVRDFLNEVFRRIWYIFVKMKEVVLLINLLEIIVSIVVL